MVSAFHFHGFFAAPFGRACRLMPSFPWRVFGPGGCHFEGVAFRGFPEGIAKVQRFANLVDE